MSSFMLINVRISFLGCKCHIYISPIQFGITSQNLRTSGLETNILIIDINGFLKASLHLETSIFKWKRFENQKEILAASVLLQKEPMRLLREDQNGLWLVR